MMGEAPKFFTNRLRLTAIDDVALDAIDAQWAGPEFPWRRICGQTRPYVRRFETAIWIGNNLEGLCIGRASRGGDNVTVHFLERKRGSQIKGYVAAISFDAADAYAVLIGQRRVKLKNPAQGALPLYGTLGFTLAETYRQSTYYERIV